jgi:hypothetical protein
MKRVALVGSLLLTLLGWLPRAQAIPEVLREGTHPMWASLSFGPAVKLHDIPTQFKLIQTFGYHFLGGADGPAIAIDLQEAFGDHFTSIELLPKFVWDFRIVPGLGLYLSPSFGFGFAAFVFDEDIPGRDDSFKGMTLQFAFEAKLILADRGLVFFRPVGVDILPMSYHDNWETGARWDLMFGGGAIF